MSINLNGIELDLDLQFYVHNERVEKIKLNSEGEIVFVIKEYKFDGKDRWGDRNNGRWEDVEYSVEQVSLRTRPKTEDERY